MPARDDDAHMDLPETRYARTDDGVYLAYQVSGSGAFDLAWLHGYLGGLEILWEHPSMASFYEALGRVARVIRYDMRATGLSDRATELPTLETQVEDLRTVLDEVGSYSTVIAGAGPSGASAALFAATHPARTRALVLWTAWVTGTGVGGPTKGEAERDIQMADESWGTDRYAGAMIAENAPSLVGDRTVTSWMAKLLRHWVTPGAAAELLKRQYETDAEEVYRSIRVPTLVAARHWDDPDDDEQVATMVPGATLIRLPGQDVASFAGDRRALAETIASFVRGLEPSTSSASSDRTLATVLFTDIVASTDRAATLGDRGWRLLVEQHHGRVRRLLDAFAGTEVDTAGDGFFVTFDGPARAVRCAAAIVQDVRDLGLEVRAGVHTGEVETIDGKAGGMAAVIGARIAGLAGPSEVLVSSTVRDLVAGSGLVFEHAGEHELKGVPDRWQLYRVAATDDRA